MRVIKTYLALTLLFLCGLTSAQNTTNSSFTPAAMERVVVMQPTGDMINDLPEMVLISDTLQLYKKVNDIVSNSFVKDAVELYFLAENYLYNKNKITAIEPAYLALSKNDGGFAKVGFYLKNEGGHIEKSNTPYIDIVKGRIEGNYEKLMSITQLYPHEMGHLIYGMLNSNNGDYSSRSVDMHYFSVITDYSTAFNEGFAEHIENISRIFEQNDAIKQGIFSDIERIKERSQFAINGFEKDFIFPFRLGYFKISMLFWYQKYENLKRYEHVVKGKAKYLNSTLDLDDIEDQLTIRNAGIRPDENNIRNYVQMLSTEGVISSFFTQFTQSEASEHFLDAPFYKPFLTDTIAIINSPKEVFTTTQNQFLKYFTVFHEHMTSDNTSGSEFVDFMEGYLRAFPSEERVLKNTFKEVTGLKYTNDLPPELWMLVKNHSHRILVPDPYGAFKIPFYTFNLNSAEAEDLLTLKGLKKEDAQRIIEYRRKNGFFNSLDQIKEIEGISNQSVELILNSEYDEEFVKGVSRTDLNFMLLAAAPLKHLIFYVTAYFILIMGLIYMFFLRKKEPAIKRIISLSLIYLLQWIVFVLSGLLFVALTSPPWHFVLVLSMFFMVINVLIYRKKKTHRKRSLFATCLMGILILISVV